MQTTSIGYMAAYAAATCNTKGTALNNERGGITQALAQYFACSPDAAAIETECAAIAAGYNEAAAKGHKVGKTAAATLQSQFRKIAAALRGEVKHGIEGNAIVTFKKADDGTIVAFGNGSISKEYTAILQQEKTAIERVAALDSAKRDAIAAHEEFLKDCDRQRAELMALVK